MSQVYQLHLKGFVGGADFDRDYVDYVLLRNAESEVAVLIDSLGGNLATALSIASSFRQHGNVSVHFVGMNASAATIASLGAKRITMDSSAMYLVHKCSSEFFQFASLNADDVEALIEELKATKADLDKLDANVAEMYARKCKKAASDLLILMKAGGWLTAKEAQEWGFVDEITDYEGEAAPRLTDAVASAMASVGMPIPDVPVADKESAFGRFLQSLAALFKSKPNADQHENSDAMEASKSPESPNNLKSEESTDGLSPKSEESQINPTTEPPKNQENLNTQPTQAISNKIPNTTMHVFTEVCALLKLDTIKAEEGSATLSIEQVECLEAALTQLKAAKADLEQQVAALKQAPAATTTQVVNNHESHTQPSEAEVYCNTINSARSLFNNLP